MLKNKILSFGVDGVSTIPTSSIPFAPELIKACEQNRCGNYGKCHTCPPLIGNTDELIEKVKSFKNITVFMKVYQLEDCFDIEGMRDGRIDFGKMLAKINDFVIDENIDGFVLSAGGCSICEKCAAIDNLPCRYPKKALSSVEAHAIDVSSLSRACGLQYNNGPNNVTYFGAICNNL